MNVDHLLNQTCTVYPVGNQDKFGKTAFGTGVSESCRFMRTTRVIATMQKERSPIDGILTFKATSTVTLNSKINFQAQNYRVVRIEPVIDGAGTTRHIKVMVADWDN